MKRDGERDVRENAADAAHDVGHVDHGDVRVLVEQALVGSASAPARRRAVDGADEHLRRVLQARPAERAR